MDKWSKKFNNLKSNAYNNTVGRAKHAANSVKNGVKNSAPVKDFNELRQAQGVKGKLGTFGKQRGRAIKKRASKFAKNFKESDIGQRLIAAAKVLVAVLKFVKRNAKLIMVISFLVTVFGFLTLYIISITQAVGASPHFYCEIDPDDYMKDTAFYQQYCQESNKTFNLNSINGHYIVQDGQGPAYCCAMHNLIARFICLQGGSYYDTLWNEQGIYPISNNSKCSFEKYHNIREFLIKGSTDTMETTSESDSPHGSKAFAALNGKADYTGANWGYVRDANIDFSTSFVGVYEDMSNSSKWVWDLTLPTNATWELQVNNGDKFSFASLDHGGWTMYTGKLTQVAGHWGSGDELRKLLEEHPDGVVVYRRYGENEDGTPKTHAIVVTGYDENYPCMDGSKGSFLCVDSGLGMAGGFEGPIDNPLFCLNTIWTNEMLENPKSEDNIYCYWYIDALTPTHFETGFYGGTSPFSAMVVSFVHEQLNKPYIWGTQGPDSFDCSGLIVAALNYAGYNGRCDHNADWQAHNLGVPVDRNEIQPGDFIYSHKEDLPATFANHASIYVGDGKMIHAAGEDKGVILEDAWMLSENRLVAVRRAV